MVTQAGGNWYLASALHLNFPDVLGTTVAPCRSDNIQEGPLPKDWQYQFLHVLQEVRIFPERKVLSLDLFRSRGASMVVV